MTKLLEDAGEAAAARGLGYEAMTLRPKDATVRFVVEWPPRSS